ncbi:hypothetical protein [Frigoriglobus tundricola]|uniref:hypothetical protein n=1 Tax=Frigoriglobus tundricola TaxID=2774151 RepID=UPI00148E9B1F|nr:hypothetical protein [Frigoriglobus tundricola]
MFGPTFTGTPGTIGYGRLASAGAGYGTAGLGIFSAGIGSSTGRGPTLGIGPIGGYEYGAPGPVLVGTSGGQGTGWPVAASKQPPLRPTGWHGVPVRGPDETTAGR